MQTIANVTQNIKSAVSTMSIPKTCKAQVFEEANAGLVYKDVPVTQPSELKEGEILIKVLACGVCHSDSAFGTGAFGPLFPRIPGHEVSTIAGVSADGCS